IGFADRTVNVLEAKGVDGKPVEVLIARRPMGANSFEDVVRAHQEQERRALRGWKSLFVRESVIDGCIAIETGIRWKGDTGLLYQRQTHIAVDGLVVVLIVNAPVEETEACDELMLRMVNSVNVRRDVALVG